MALGAAEGGNDFFIFIYMLSSILSIAYLMPIVARAFFFAPKPDPHDDHHDDHHGHNDDGGRIKEPLLLCGPPVVTALGCLILFLYAQDIHTLLAQIQWGG